MQHSYSGIKISRWENGARSNILIGDRIGSTEKIIAMSMLNGYLGYIRRRIRSQSQFLIPSLVYSGKDTLYIGCRNGQIMISGYVGNLYFLFINDTINSIKHSFI